MYDGRAKRQSENGEEVGWWVGVVIELTDPLSSWSEKFDPGFERSIALFKAMS